NPLPDKGVRVRLPPPAPMFIRVYEYPGIYRLLNFTLGVTVGVTLDVPFSLPIQGGGFLHIRG
ncbi:hypothetical protein ACFL39_01895, partial [Gemmatimonadota bacterium]